MIGAMLVALALGTPGGSARPDVSLQPAVIALKHTSSVVVTGITAPALQMRLAGATTASGRPLGWTSMHRIGVGWVGTIRAPARRGVYPVQLRTGPAGPVLSSPRWLLKVFARGTLARPAFATPEQVARWWVRAVGRGKLVAMRRWSRPTSDRRDTRLHRLFVVAYSKPGHPAVRDRLGMFVTAVRAGYAGRWRLLEANVLP
jgi:hypothetical protein